MNILTFDIEEWYVEKMFFGGRAFKYKQYDEVFIKVLDELDRLGIKATFFCVGQMAVSYPEIVREISARGHEIGCHSNTHTLLNKMDDEMLRHDTVEALKVLEDLTGQKVLSYRAPAFSISSQNKWTVNVLADCGILFDASIFPTSRDFGGYKGFPQDTPCVIANEGMTLKEFPICLTSLFGKRIAYSGGGYFRLLPFWYINRTVRKRDYNISYFHLADLIEPKIKMLSKEEYEKAFKEPGTLQNRIIRYLKCKVRDGDTFDKMDKMLTSSPFVSILEADKMMDWNNAPKITL